MNKINIGCGMDYREGWINTDISHAVKADVYFDIGKEEIQTVFGINKEQVPVKEEQFDLVYCSGVLEQILLNEELIHAMNEMHRVLKKGGVCEIVVPNAEHAIAFQDPMDVRKFTPKTFAYFIDGEREYNLYGKVYGFKPWSSCEINENSRGILEVKLIK